MLLLLSVFLFVSLFNFSLFILFQFPRSSEEWTNIGADFGHLHQFWNTLGAIDGKYIAIKKPVKSGSLYYNYKGFFSIVLLAVVNAKTEFIMVDVGMNGRISDGGVMSVSYTHLDVYKRQGIDA